MGYSAKVGSFNIDTTKTAGQTQVIDGVGFQPKVVLFWWSGSTGTVDTVSGGTYRGGFGAASSSTARFSMTTYSLDAAADSATQARVDTASVIYIFADGTPTIEGILDFSSMNADGFTLIVDDQFINAYRISYLALGGTDLTNIYIGNFAVPATTGEYSVSDPGFQPDAVIFATDIVQNLTWNQINLYVGLGMATGASNQGTVCARVADAQVTSATDGYCYNGEAVAMDTGPTDVLYRNTFVAFTETGFTLNNLEGASARYVFYVALKGGQYSVGDLTTRTDGNDITETVGFQPVAILFASANRALSTQDTPTAHARLSIGGATSVSNRACAAWSDENGLADTETAYANYDSAVYANVVDDAAAGLMDLKSIDANGFTCVMDTADPAGCWVTYLAIGASGAAALNVDLEASTVQVPGIRIYTP